MEPRAINDASVADRSIILRNPNAPLQAVPSTMFPSLSRPIEEAKIFSAENIFNCALSHFSEKPCAEPELSVGKQRIPSRYKILGIYGKHSSTVFPHQCKNNLRLTYKHNLGNSAFKQMSNAIDTNLN